MAIARAIAIEPALLLFDEPLSNLDVTLREATRGELRELVARLGLTAVYVTHDQEEAFALCDRISVMVGGRILQTGQPRDLYERPAQLSVARFLGRNNLIKVMRLSSSKEGIGEFKTLEGGHTLRFPFSTTNWRRSTSRAHLPFVRNMLIIKHDGERLTNALPAQVREINFAGATSSIKLDANGLTLWNALSAGSRMDCLSEQAVSWLFFPPERISLLKNE